MSFGVTRPDLSSTTVTLPEKMYEDVRGIVLAPAEVVQRGIERSRSNKDVLLATDRERDKRAALRVDVEKLAVHEVFRSSPPRGSPLDSYGWFKGKAYREALQEEECAATRREEESQAYLKELEIHREMALREHELAEKRKTAAEKATESYDRSKTGWFWWR